MSASAQSRRRSDPRSTLSAAQGFLPGARKDRRLIQPDWTPVRDLIDGVRIQEVRHVPKGSGHLTEIFRRDWALDAGVVEHVFQVWLGPREVSAWHTHAQTCDRLFVTHGLVRIVLYDARSGSATCGMLNELRFGTPRPALVTVPPGVWHGLQNLSGEPSALLNLTDRAYSYDDPDHWRLPPDTDRIPFRLTR